MTNKELNVLVKELKSEIKILENKECEKCKNIVKDEEEIVKAVIKTFNY